MTAVVGEAEAAAARAEVLTAVLKQRTVNTPPPTWASLQQDVVRLAAGDWRSAWSSCFVHSGLVPMLVSNVATGWNPVGGGAPFTASHSVGAVCATHAAHTDFHYPPLTSDSELQAAPSSYQQSCAIIADTWTPDELRLLT